jgi:hypothetical protein
MDMIDVLTTKCRVIMYEYAVVSHWIGNVE